MTLAQSWERVAEGQVRADRLTVNGEHSSIEVPSYRNIPYSLKDCFCMLDILASAPSPSPLPKGEGSGFETS